MKKLLVFLMLTSLNSMAANSPADVKCFESDAEMKELQSGLLCRGVKSDSEAKAVMKCYADAAKNITTNYRATVLCSGVKSDFHSKVVMKCFKDVKGEQNGDRAAILCSGLKTYDEAREVVKCFENLDAPGDASALMCSKTGFGSHLLIK